MHGLPVHDTFDELMENSGASFCDRTATAMRCRAGSNADQRDDEPAGGLNALILLLAALDKLSIARHRPPSPTIAAVNQDAPLAITSSAFPLPHPLFESQDLLDSLAKACLTLAKVRSTALTHPTSVTSAFETLPFGPSA
ncbi:hypothetical protein G7046_g3631 [Stylonectria norvegica]|nr:hypothetical protein G7046_g3631 [Stylonectria norvegica]